MTTGNKISDEIKRQSPIKEFGQSDLLKIEKDPNPYEQAIARLYNSNKISERFVGRGDELSKLADWAKRSLKGQGKPVFIIGDPGIGKTELVNQFFDNENLPEIKENEHKNILVGRYYNVGKNTSYRVFVDGFTRAISFLEKLEKQHPDDLLFKEIKILSTQLQEIKDLSTSTFLQENDKERAKYKSFELLAQSYEVLCSIFPVVLFLDDLQWADELELEFLAYLIRNMQEKPFFLVCTIRERELFAENHPLRAWMRSMSRYNSYEQIKLRPFNETETEGLINKIFVANHFADTTFSKLHKETGGNPYYLIEIIRQLIEDKKIRWTGDVWQADTLDEVQLPSSLIDLIELQLSRLTDYTLNIFQQAAVIGENFSFQALQLLTNLEDRELTLALAEGLKQFLIREEPATLSSSSEKYSFRYNTTRKVLYEKLLVRERKLFHGKLAKVLEEGKIDANDFDQGNIAYHYLQSGDTLKAFHWSVKAASSAASKFTFDKAGEFFEWATKALEVLEKASKLPTDLDLGHYYCSYGQYKISVAEYDEALKQLNSAQMIFQRIKEQEKEAETLISIGNCLRQTSNFGEALEAYEKALNIVRTLNTYKLMWAAAYGAARCEMDLEHFEIAIKFLGESLKDLNNFIETTSEFEREQLEESRNEIRVLLTQLEEKQKVKRTTFEQKKLSLPEKETTICQPNTPLDKSSHLVEVISSPLEIFKICALEFKNLHNTNNILGKFAKAQIEPPRVVGLIFTQLKQIKSKINSVDPLTINAQLDIIDKHLNEYKLWLRRMSDTVPPYTLRQYLDQGVLLQEEMLQLARFIISIRSDANDDKIKLEMLLNRALEIEVDRYDIIISLFPIEEVFEQLSNSESRFRSLQEVLKEWDEVTNYSQVMEINLLNKVKQSKSNLGELFWHPEILSLIVEVNLKQEFRMKELIKNEQKEVGAICEKLIKSGIKTLPRQGQSGALDLGAAHRMIDRAMELVNNNHENNRSGLIMLAEVGRLLRNYFKEQNVNLGLEDVFINTAPKEKNSSEPVFHAQPVVNTPQKPTQVSPNQQVVFIASPVLDQENPKVHTSQASNLTPNLNSNKDKLPNLNFLVQQVTQIEEKSDNESNLLNKTFVGNNQHEIVLRSRLEEICLLLATKLRDVPVKVLQLKRSQLTLASWEVEALLSDNETSNLGEKKHGSLMRRAIALLAEMQEVGVASREISSSGKAQELDEIIKKANYLLEQAKIASNELEMQSHEERNKEEYTKAQNLVATRQKLISTHQLLSSIISWLRR
jgi:predicted ATPase